MDDRSFEFDGISPYGDPISAEMLFHNGLIRPINHYQQHSADDRSITRISDENGFSQRIGQESKSCNDHLIVRQVQKKSNVSKHSWVRYCEREIIEKPAYGRKSVNGYATKSRRVPMAGCNCTKAHENRWISFLSCRGCFLCCINPSGAVENCHDHYVTKPKGFPHSMER